MNPWILAIRPKTLPAAIAPVLIGTAMAYADGGFHLIAALCALFAALFIQIATNLANDYFDFKKGADTKERRGPIRVTQAGLIKPIFVLIASVVFFALAGLMSLYLIDRGGWPITVIAIASILFGFLYTAGPFALAYLGLGEVFVLLFFGPVAVAGTYYTQTLDCNWAVVAAGLGPGFLSSAILAVNNLRDIEGDSKVGKHTLAVRFGRSFAVNEYLFLILAAAFTPFLVHLITADHNGIAFASLIVVLAIPLIKSVFTQHEAEILNKVLAQTGRLLLIYSVAFSLGWMLCSR